MKNKNEFRLLQKQLQKWDTDILHIDEEISSRALFYIQEYALSHSMRLADALIAATAIYYKKPLLTANDKHYKFLPTMKCHKFIP
jgi:predicted nucleic acid-binding protein